MNQTYHVNRKVLLTPIIGLLILNLIVFAIYFSGFLIIFETQNRLILILLFNLLIIILIGSVLGAVASKIEVNDREILVYRPFGLIKVDTAHDQLVLSNPYPFLLKIKKSGFSFTEFFLPTWTNNYQEILSILKEFEKKG